MRIEAAVSGRIVEVSVEFGQAVSAGQVVAVLEVMKMEHPVLAPMDGVIDSLDVEVGSMVIVGQVVANLVPGDGPAARVDDRVESDLLAEVQTRHALTLDGARPSAVQSRREMGRMTAREYVAALCDDFVEYGPLAIAAQRSRKSLDELIRDTPADGMVGGVGRINSSGEREDRVVVVSYDYTVLAGTQGFHNHVKKDRLFGLAADMDLPVVLFAEGGGGRPGDVDWPGVSLLEVQAFRLFAEISSPTIGVNTGFCFAGNAALLGQCDVIVATADSNLGMGGPAMIEGGGLGRVEPTAVGPSDTQATNGVVDVVVPEDNEAVASARLLVAIARGDRAATPSIPDQALLRQAVPNNRRRIYDMRALIEGLVDSGSFIELRREYGRAAITGLARVEGQPIGIIANDPAHVGGAIDRDAADTLVRHLELCERWSLPLLSLCDTPGFMVGPEAESAGLVRAAGSLFRAAAALTTPIGTVVTRRGYGLGAMAMAGGGFHEGRFVVGWPTSEIGPMGLEGAVRLGFRRELAAIDDDGEREGEVDKRVQEMLDVGRGLNIATHFEIDDVIDPADTRRWIQICLLAN